MSVCISIGYIAHLPHAILQVLPADAAAQVFDDYSVVCPCGWPIPVGAAIVGPRASWRRGPAGSSVRQLDHHPFAIQLSAVQLVHGVIGVAVVIKLHKSESIFKQDFTDLSKTTEEPLQVAFPDAIAEVANVDPGHDLSGCFAVEPGDDATGGIRMR